MEIIKQELNTLAPNKEKAIDLFLTLVSRNQHDGSLCSVVGVSEAHQQLHLFSSVVGVSKAHQQLFLFIDNE